MSSSVYGNKRSVPITTYIFGAAAVLLIGIGIGVGVAPKSGKSSGATSKGVVTPVAASEAAATAVKFLDAYSEAATTNDTKAFNTAVTELNMPFSDSTFVTDVKKSMTATKGTVTDTAYFRVIPTGYKTSSNGTKTFVTVYSVTLLADPGTDKTLSLWTTSQFEMQLYLDKWHISKWTVTNGPSYANVDAPKISAYELDQQLKDVKDFTNVPT